MGYHIIMDSVGDRSEELMAMENFSVAALTIIIDDEEFIDNNKLNQGMLLKKIAASKECPQSACPSPAEYQDLFEKHKEGRIYVIAGSSELTGSYNSAKVAEKLFLEKYPNSKIMIFDSKTACAGETLLVYKMIEFEQAYSDFEKVVEMTKQFIKKQEIVFALEDISFLLKNGRLTGIKALLATALNIVPILSADEHGVISHCNALERAENLKQELIDIFSDLDVKVVDTGGVATLYAGDGGIVVSY